MQSLIPDLIDMFPDIVVMQAGTYDQRGAFTPVGDPVDIVAYCHGVTGETRTGDGKVVHGAKVRCVLAGVYGATTRHQYTLPARFVPNQPRALMVDQATDENGPHHEIVFF